MTSVLTTPTIRSRTAPSLRGAISDRPSANASQAVNKRDGDIDKRMVSGSIGRWLRGRGFLGGRRNVGHPQLGFRSQGGSQFVETLQLLLREELLPCLILRLLK